MGTRRFPFGLRTDVIEELRLNAGITVGGVKLLSNQVTASQINEKVAGAGVVVDGLTIKDGRTLAAVETGTAGTNVTLVDYCAGALHKTILTLASCATAFSKGTGNTGKASAALFTFPEGAVALLGASVHLTGAVTASWNPTTPIASLGSTATAADDEALTGTEADILGSTALTIAADATSFKAPAAATLRPVLDGSTTAAVARLNVACNSDPGAAKSIAWNGTVILLWAFLGDLT